MIVSPIYHNDVIHVMDAIIIDDGHDCTEAVPLEQQPVRNCDSYKICYNRCKKCLFIFFILIFVCGFIFFILLDGMIFFN
uniref:Uncharacterized protein n=1 Tax=viral metagenome TaxID=1070528 RepID=A0A6C0JGC4_9ZZZZ